MIEKVVVVEIHITIYKKEKQTNKKRKQAYVRVDLNLNDS